jgi:hypothetical protein
VVLRYSQIYDREPFDSRTDRASARRRSGPCGLARDRPGKPGMSNIAEDDGFVDREALRDLALILLSPES